MGCQTGIVKTNDGTIKEVDQIEETAEDSNQTTINEDNDNSTDLQVMNLPKVKIPIQMNLKKRRI